MLRFITFAFCLVFAITSLAAEFEPGTAASDAGKIADEKKEEFYAYFIPADSPIESTSAEISKHLAASAKAKANFAVFGPNYGLNATILTAALKAVSKGSLKGATILYVHGGEDVEALNKLATSTGAIFRSTKYSGQ